MTGIHPLSLNFWVNEASGDVGVYTSEKLASQNIGIATEFASTSVSVAKLIVLLVSDTFTTSGLHLTVFSIVEVDASGSGSGVPENCIVATEITLKGLHVA